MNQSRTYPERSADQPPKENVMPTTPTLDSLTVQLDALTTAAAQAETDEVRAALYLFARTITTDQPTARYALITHSDQGDWWDGLTEVHPAETGVDPVMGEPVDLSDEAADAAQLAASHFYDSRESVLDAFEVPAPDVWAGTGTGSWSKILDLGRIVTELDPAADTESSASRQHHADSGTDLPAPERLMVVAGGTAAPNVAAIERPTSDEESDASHVTIVRADGILIADLIVSHDAVAFGSWPDGEEWVAHASVEIDSPNPELAPTATH